MVNGFVARRDDDAVTIGIKGFGRRVAQHKTCAGGSGCAVSAGCGVRRVGAAGVGGFLDKGQALDFAESHADLQHLDRIGGKFLAGLRIHQGQHKTGRLIGGEVELGGVLRQQQTLDGRTAGAADIDRLGRLAAKVGRHFAGRGRICGHGLWHGICGRGLCRACGHGRADAAQVKVHALNHHRLGVVTEQEVVQHIGKGGGEQIGHLQGNIALTGFDEARQHAAQGTGHGRQRQLVAELLTHHRGSECRVLEPDFGGQKAQQLLELANQQVRHRRAGLSQGWQIDDDGGLAFQVSGRAAKLDDQRREGAVHIAREDLRRVYGDAAEPELDGFAQKVERSARCLKDELRRHEGGRVNHRHGDDVAPALHRTQESIGGQFGQHRRELTAAEQCLQVNEFEQGGAGPAKAGGNAPLVLLTGVIDGAQHFFKLKERQVRVGQHQLDGQLWRRKHTIRKGHQSQHGHFFVRQRGQRELDAGSQQLDVSVGLGGITLEEVQGGDVFPASANFQADVKSFFTQSQGGKRYLFFEVGHVAAQQVDKLVDPVQRGRQRQQLVPIAGVGVVLLAEVDFRVFTAHVAVDSAAFAASLVVIGDQHLVAKGHFLQAVAAAQVDLEIVAVAFARRFASHRNHRDLGADAGRVRGLDQHVAAHHHGFVNQGRAVRKAHVGVGGAADRVGAQHHAGRSAAACRAGFVAGHSLERGSHGRLHGQVAAEVERAVLHPCQGLGRNFSADVGAHNGAHGLAQQVLRLPANGVEGQGHAHGGATGRHGGGVFGADAGGVPGLDRKAAAGNDGAVGHGGAAAAEHQVVGNQGIDGNRAAGFGFSGFCVGSGGGFFFGRRGRGVGAYLARRRGRRLASGGCGVGHRIFGGGSLVLGQGSRRAGNRGVDLRRFQCADSGVATQVQCHAVQTGLHRGANVIARDQAANGGAAAAAGFQADIGVDLGAIGGADCQVAAHHQGHARGGVGQAQPVGGHRVGLDRADPGQGARADLVLTQNETHGCRSARRLGAVGHRGRNQRAGLCAERIVQRAGHDFHVASDGERAADQARAHLGGLLGPDVGTQQGVQRAEQNVLRLPANRVEGQRDTHGRTVRGHGGGVVRRDGGDVVALDGQLAFNEQGAVGHRGQRLAEHHIGGDQAVDGQARGLAFFGRGRGLARQAGLDGGTGQGQHQDIAAGIKLHAVHQRFDAAAHIVAHHQAAHGGAASAARGHAGVSLDGGGVAGRYRQAGAHGDLQARIGVEVWGDDGANARAEHIAGQHKARAGAGTAGAGLAVNAGADLRLGRGRHTHAATHVKAAAGDHRAGHQGLLVADGRANEGVNARKQQVLRLPADGVERQGQAHGGATAFGDGAVGRFNRGGVVCADREVAACGDIAVGDPGLGARQNQVAGNQTVGGQGAGRLGRGFAAGRDFATERGVDQGGGGGADLRVGPGVEFQVEHIGFDGAAHIIAGDQAAHGHAGAVGARCAGADTDVGGDARLVGGRHGQAALQGELGRWRGGVGVDFGGYGVARGGDGVFGLALDISTGFAARAVAGQHGGGAHRQGGGRGLHLVAQGRAQVHGVVGRDRDIAVSRHGAAAHGSHHLVGLAAKADIGAQQAVQTGRAHIAHFPANGVERQRNSGRRTSGARRGTASRAVGADARRIARTHRQAAFDGGQGGIIDGGGGAAVQLVPSQRAAQAQGGRGLGAQFHRHGGGFDTQGGLADRQHADFGTNNDRFADAGLHVAFHHVHRRQGAQRHTAEQCRVGHHFTAGADKAGLIHGQHPHLARRHDDRVAHQRRNRAGGRLLDDLGRRRVAGLVQGIDLQGRNRQIGIIHQRQHRVHDGGGLHPHQSRIDIAGHATGNAVGYRRADLHAAGRARHAGRVQAGVDGGGRWCGQGVVAQQGGDRTRHLQAAYTQIQAFGEVGYQAVGGVEQARYLAAVHGLDEQGQVGLLASSGQAEGRATGHHGPGVLLDIGRQDAQAALAADHQVVAGAGEQLDAGGLNVG